jgi:hypothetical protein
MAQVPIAELLTDITLLCREAPGIVLQGAYLRAARMFCGKTRWLQKPSAFTTEADNAASLTEDGRKVDVLTEGYSGEWDPNQVTDTPRVPDSYQYVPEGQMALYRTPNQAWQVNLTAVVQPKRDAPSIDATLVIAWDYALQAGALMYLLNLARTPWTDKVEARAQEAKFVGLCNQAHMSMQRGFNAGAQTTDRAGSSSGAIRTRILPI